MNKYELICDEHYSVKDIHLYKIDNRYYMYSNSIIFKIEKEFNTLRICNNWIILLHNNSRDRYSLIDIYNYNIETFNNKEIYNKILLYIKKNLSKDLILDFYKNEYKNDTVYGAYCIQYEHINLIKIEFENYYEIVGIVDKECSRWIIEPYIDMPLSNIIDNKRNYIVKISKEYYIIKALNKAYILYKDMILGEHGEYDKFIRVGKYSYNIIFRATRDKVGVIININTKGHRLKEIATYRGKLVETINKDIVLKPVYINKILSHYKLINMQKNEELEYPVYTYNNLRIIIYKKDTKFKCIANKFDTIVKFGDIEDIEVIDRSNSFNTSDININIINKLKITY